MCVYKVNIEQQKSSSVINTGECLPKLATYPSISPSENSFTFSDDNDIIEFGPIKVKPRKKPAPTLATGRRSKYEVLSPDEHRKRDARRARNRAAAERVRLSRLNVEQQLQAQIDALKTEEEKLSFHIQMLQDHKLRLETRIFTHKQICPAMSFYNHQDDILSAFTPSNTSITTISQQISEIDLDEILSNLPLPIEQPEQNNTSNSLTPMLPSDIFDDIFMDF